MTFEAFAQGDQKIWPDQQKDNDWYKYKYKDNDKDNNMTKTIKIDLDAGQHL